jgi:tetratricopeptide (TPR) repeat protein
MSHVESQNEIAQRLPPQSKAPSSATKTAIERRFQQALFAYYRGETKSALKDFEKVAELSKSVHDETRYVEANTYILRILAEREEFSRIELIESQIFSVLTTRELPVRLKSRVMYILGICSCYQDSRHDQAMNRFREAIDYAVASDDKEALASPLYGAATVLYARGRYDEALKELSQLDILLSCLSLPELSATSNLLRALIRRNQSRLDEALEAAWTAYETLKNLPQLWLYMQTLVALGTIYTLKGDLTCAKLYLDLADRSLKRDEFPRVARLVDEAMAAIRKSGRTEADLAYDTRTGILTSRLKGEVRFEGQFILRDLLRVFLESPGRVFSKEDLAKKVWKDTYNPRVHDNKIYVTIKRLRGLLEGDANGDLILRAKTGYFLNPKVRVVIDDEAVQVQSQGETPIDGAILEQKGMEI